MNKELKVIDFYCKKCKKSMKVSYMVTGNRNVIEIRCKKCNKLMMEYFVCGDDSAVALQNIGIKCDRCKRVMILKKYSEGMMKEHSENGTFRI